jgi:DNA polymerase elongation subunit (family B)
VFNGVSVWYDYKKSYGEILKLYDDIEPCYQFINDKYPEAINYDVNKLTVLLYDIENKKDPDTGKFSPPHEANGAITAITVKDVFRGTVYCLSTEKFYKEQMEITVSGKLHYKFCYSEKELLTYFVKLIDKLKPDILSGYNSEGYDDPYTINRCIKVIGKKKSRMLSPVRGRVQSKHRVDENNKDRYDNKIDGVALVDYMLLYQKNVGKYESNTLSFVAGVELGEDKVGYEEYDNLEELRVNNPQKYVEYNIKDVELLAMIDNKRKLFNLVATVAYFCKCNFDDVMGSIKQWDCLIYSYLNKRDISIPPYTTRMEKMISGGYIKKDIEAGIFKNVISLDLKALYPSLSITLNISPDTLIPEDRLEVKSNGIDERLVNMEIEHNDNTILAGSGYKFRKDKVGFYPAIYQLLMDERDVSKKEKLETDKLIQTFEGSEEEKEELVNKYSNLHTFEQAVKLLMNSGYGILASKFCRYYSPELASSITISGQLAIKYASKVVTDYLDENYGKSSRLRFTHTDSCFIDLDGIAEGTEEIDTFYKEHLEQLIANGYQKLCDYLNADRNLLILKREKICSHYLITAPAKYACLITDKEGVRYSEPKLDVTGLEIVRSSTPSIIKPYLKTTLIKMMKNENVLEYIDEVKKIFYSLTPKQIAFPRSANNLAKWVKANGSFVSGTPIGVRAAHNYNRYIETHNLDKNKIVEGDKIKFLYLTKPNPVFNQHVLGFIRDLPEPSLEKYVDYKTQYDKVYYNVIKLMADRVHFDLEKDKESLEDIF